MKHLWAIIATSATLLTSPTIAETNKNSFIDTSWTLFYTYADNHRACFAGRVRDIIGIVCKGNKDIPWEKNEKFDCQNLGKGTRMCLFSWSLEDLNNFGNIREIK